MLCRDEEAERAKPRAVRDGWQAHDEGVPGSRLRRKAFARLCSTVSVRCDQTRPRSITSMSVVTGSDRFGSGIFTVSGASPSNRVGVQIPASAPTFAHDCTRRLSTVAAFQRTAAKVDHASYPTRAAVGRPTFAHDCTRRLSTVATQARRWTFKQPSLMRANVRASVLRTAQRRYVRP